MPRQDDVHIDLCEEALGALFANEGGDSGGFLIENSAGIRGAEPQGGFQGHSQKIAARGLGGLGKLFEVFGNAAWKTAFGSCASPFARAGGGACSATRVQ